MSEPRIVDLDPGEILLIGDSTSIKLRSDRYRGTKLEVKTDQAITIGRWNVGMLVRALARRRRK